LFRAKNRTRLERWFTPGRTTRDAAGLRQILMTGALLLATRRAGYPTPRPEFVPRDDAVVVARWLAEKKQQGHPGLLFSNTSPAVRVCLAARDAGLDISGSLILAGGEPYTAGKARVVESVGARTINILGMAELLYIGAGCANSLDQDDLHLFTDKIGLIQREKRFGPGLAVDELIYTSLLPFTPKLMINVESGDYATLRESDCGCELGEAGFSLHALGLRSHEKLTSEGVTFMGSELYHLLEEVLPARFGGGPMDYQLVETEEGGVPRVSLLISPSVGPLDEAQAVRFVLDTLAANPHGGQLMVDQWRQGDTLRVLRREPISTRTAKVLPLHVLQGQDALTR
jgi:hypothetical protein